MSIQGNIRKILFVTLWSVIGAGALVLLIAAINNRNNKSCKGYDIKITGAGGQLFVDKKEVLSILTNKGVEKLTGKPIASFNLQELKDSVEKNPWVKKVEVFFDNNEMLRVNISERDPVARIFTVGGNSFYIDSSGAQLPLSAKLAVKIPVFTSYPNEKIKSHGNDSAMLTQIRKLGAFIGNDSFWMAQIAQVDITAAKTFEMVPVIGNHTIEFGDGNNYERKFGRLFIFYKEVLGKTGFDRYSRINVSYAGQVIGTRKGSGVTRSDSIQAIKNIQQLIRTARQLQADTARDIYLPPLPPAQPYKEPEQGASGDNQLSGGGDSTGALSTTLSNHTVDKSKTKPTVLPVKPAMISKPPVKKPLTIKSNNTVKPKAVMPKSR